MINVMSLKLISGEEIIALVKLTTDMTITITKPLSFVMQYDEQKPTSGNVAFAPWMIGADLDSEYAISKSHILSMNTSTSEAQKSYLEAISYTPPVPETKTQSGARGSRGATATAIGNHRSAPQADA